MCAEGFYQPLSKQLQCLPCPAGTTSRHAGASMCRVCPAGTYGVNCNSTCGECAHGKCHAASGQCVCDSGWEGAACDTGRRACVVTLHGLTFIIVCLSTDIMGCSVDSCFPGVNCFDIKAPGTGFVCADCPAGMRGDGSFCEIIPLGISL